MAADLDSIPTIKKGICFADNLDIACGSLNDGYTDIPNFSESEKLMLFGVEGWKDAKSTKNFANAFERNRFENVEIFGCELGDLGAKAIADGLKKTGGKIIRNLELDSSPLTATGAKYILDSVNDNDNMEYLNLQGSVKEEASLLAMVKALQANKSIKNLNLKINEISPTGAEALGKMIVLNDVLVKLDLFYNKIGPNGATYLANALRQDCPLEILDLCCNEIGDNGAVQIGEALETNTMLKQLHLALNNIGDDGASRLCDALNPTNKDPNAAFNKTLQLLDLNANKIGKIGARAIASCISYNDSLTHINFTGIEPTPEGWEYFESAFQTLNFSKTDSQLEILFSIVDIDEEMLERIETAIGDNINVRYKRRAPDADEAAA